MDQNKRDNKSGLKTEDLDSVWTDLSDTESHLTFDLPNAWSVDYIQPELQVYRKDLKPLIVRYDTAPDEAVDALRANGYFSNRIVFIAHGFQNNDKSEWMTKITSELIKQSDQTIALVDWSRGADLLPIRYRQSAANVEPVGIWLATYVQQINHSIAGIEIWGIGHSLGAHVLGIAGRYSHCFNRISGLDPAGPCFEKREDTKELRKSDAFFVDVIHTDGYDSWLDPRDWISPVNHYGSLIPMGSIDFYPNYGYHQPGAGFHIAGSHTRAIDLYIWSIGNPGKFRTFERLDGLPEFEKPVKKMIRSSNFVEMGFHCYFGNHSEGCYYLATNSSEPWVPVEEDKRQL